MTFSGGRGVVERSAIFATLFFMAGGMVMVALWPEMLAEGAAGFPFSATVHVFTLGGIVGGFYPICWEMWRRFYGREPVAPWLCAVIPGIHFSGLAVMIWGLAAHQTLPAQVGGHYLVPTAIVLAFGQGVVTAWRRAPGHDRHLAAHLPGVGLLVTMSLGALLVMDAYSGKYGIYTPRTILVHMLSGGFLFLLPLVLVLDAAGADSAGSTSSTALGGIPSTAMLLFPAGLAAAGVLAVTLALAEPALPAGQGLGASLALGVPLGLVVLGGVALWVGLPAFGQSRQLSFSRVRRSLWTALGLLVLYAGLQAWRGMDAEEAFGLARFGAALFLFVVALPEIQMALMGLGPRREGAENDGGAAEEGEIDFAPMVIFLILLPAGALFLATLLGGWTLPARGAAVLWVTVLSWQTWRLARG